MSAREVVTRSAYFMISIYAFVFLRKILREDGGFSFFRVIVLRGEIIMNTLVIVLIAAVCLFCGYTFYGRWLANKWGIDPKAKTPAVALEDGQDYVPTDGWTVFAHQFSSIAGAGLSPVPFRQLHSDGFRCFCGLSLAASSRCSNRLRRTVCQCQE